MVVHFYCNCYNNGTRVIPQEDQAAQIQAVKVVGAQQGVEVEGGADQ